MKYGLIGEKLSHSYSCEIHACIADYDYELTELSPDELDVFFAKRAFNAINVTIPYKESVMCHLDVISEEARRIGAVNTVVNKEGRLYGYNTDYYGIRALVKRAGISVRGKKVLILGSGGTSKTAGAAFCDMGASDILKVSRSKRADAITYDEALLEHRDAQIIFNATPVGMYPHDEGRPIDLSAFDRLEGVLDAVYHPLKTELVLQGERLGIRAMGGLYMLAAQAVYASRLFLGEGILEADDALIERAYACVLKQKQSIVFVGMPSSGKSTVGKLLARELGRELIDTDVEIEKRIAMPIAEYFSQYGEQGFRALESELIEGVSKQSGLVVATGGGSVLDKRNVSALRRNGIIVFLDRPLDMLITTSSRPLSSSREKLEKLYDERYDIYCSIADMRIDGGNTPAQIVRDIQKELGL